MILTSQLFDTYDRCPRRYAFERTHEPRTISPLGLLYAAVEAALSGGSYSDAILDITSRMDVITGELSPISVVRHVECLSEIIALALKAKLGHMRRLEPIPFGEHQWQSNLFEGRSGDLHRLILASHMDDDTLRSYAHSWGTIGELAALERPLALTIVLIGPQRGGRRHSAWSKGFLHPIQKVLRFAPRKRDTGFTENWKQVWREQTDIKADTWLERMRMDNVLTDLMVSRQIAFNAGDERMIQARRDMLALIPRMEAATVDEPMRRSSCDELGKGACVWQSCCYSPTPATPEDFGHLYRIREPDAFREVCRGLHLYPSRACPSRGSRNQT
jgi:hypothetical protein